MRRGLLGAMPMPIRLRPCAAVGRPRVSGCHVSPPSVDLNNPLVAPVYALLYSHGACRAAHSAAYTICAFDGSNATSTPPVFSSLYKIFCHERPPSVDRNTPRSSLGPYGWPSAAT